MLEEGLEQDEVVYVSVLSECSHVHAGLIEEGLQLFNKVKYEHSLEPTIQLYVCFVDLLWRAGRLDEAFEVIKIIPTVKKCCIWHSLLGAARVIQMSS